MELTKRVKTLVLSEEPISTSKTKEKNRGRLEHRTLELYKPKGNEFSSWAKLNRVICIKRKRITKTHETNSVHYYITSLENDNANELLKMIRKHWWVENKLHYVKDVIMKEDQVKFKLYDRYKKNSVFRNVAFNCIKLLGHSSIKCGLEKYLNNVQNCLQLLRT